MWTRNEFQVSTDQSRLDIDVIHRFLSHEAYWSQNIPKEIVERAVKGSLCFGMYKGSEQVGFARVVTDRATFAWICDVFVVPAYRGLGLSKWLMACVLEMPDLRGLRRICLATRDAHTLYQGFGFRVTETPQNWMEIKNNDLYKFELDKLESDKSPAVGSTRE